MEAVASNSVQVMIVDDYVIIRAGLRLLIESDAALKVIGEVDHGAPAVTLATHVQPDIILLNVDPGGGNGADGLELIPDLLAATKETRIVVLTGARDTEFHRRAVRIGAMGLVFKEKPSEVLIKAIKRVHAGEVWVDRLMMGTLLGEMARARDNAVVDPETLKIQTLTDREREIIGLVGEGLKNKQIAGRLCISETTVRHHLTSIFDKLGVADRLELLIYAYRHGLVDALHKNPLSIRNG